MSRPVAQPFPDFQILGKIGAGAMGAVFLARQRSLDRLVALKVLKPSLSRDERYVERLKREARLVARLDHPAIVHAYDLREDNGYHYFVMEYVEGRSLRELLKDWGRLPEEQVIRIGLQVGGALEHAHRSGVIHRDVKPANILVQADGTVKLADLGLAKGPEAVAATNHEGGTTLGTPLYMSPEQARDPSATDSRSDAYSLGATLFHAACGVPPFSGATLGEVLTRVLHDPPPLPSTLFPGISSGLELVLRKCLQKEPGRRYQSLAEMAADLRRVQATGAPSVDPRELDASKPRSRAGLLGLSLLGLAAAVAALGFMFASDRKSDEPVQAASGAPEVARLREQVARAGPGELVALLVSCQVLAEQELPGAANLASLARARLHRQLIDWAAPRLEGLRQRLQEGRDLDQFDQILGRTLEETLPSVFGVTPAGIPDDTLRIWLESRREAVLQEWRDLVDEERFAELARLKEKVRAIQEAWADQVTPDFRRRRDVIQSLMTAAGPPPLPPPVARELLEARERYRAQLEGQLRREASEFAAGLNSGTRDAIRAIQDEMAGMTDSPEGLRELLTKAREHRAWLLRATPQTDTLPASLLEPGLNWSRESLLRRVQSLEGQIEKALSASELAQVQDLEQQVGFLLRRQEHAQAARLVEQAELATLEAGRRLQALAREVELTRSVPEMILAHVRQALLGKPVYLVVDQVGRTVKILRCPETPTSGNFLLEADRGLSLQVPFGKLGIPSLLALLPEEWTRSNALALTLYLYWADQISEAERAAARAPEAEMGPLLARIRERAGELELPQKQREDTARRLLAELKERVHLALHRESLSLADELLGRHGTTLTVQQNRAQILALRDQAAVDARSRAERGRVEGLFPGWQMDFLAWPVIRATADLREIAAGFIPGEGWIRRSGQGLHSTRGESSFIPSLGRPWTLPTHLDGQQALSARLELRLSGEEPPGLILFSCHGLHVGLVRPVRGRSLPALWVPFRSAGEGLVERSNLFLEEVWAAWASGQGQEGRRLLPGSIYTLEVELGPEVGQERRVRFLLDGEELLPEARVRSPRRGPGTLEVRIAGAATILSIALGGQPVAKGGGE